MNTRKLSRAAAWPMNSPSDLGRRAASWSSGWRWGERAGLSVMASALAARWILKQVQDDESGGWVSSCRPFQGHSHQFVQLRSLAQFRLRMRHGARRHRGLEAEVLQRGNG